jgi:hypothetical protein
MAFGIVSKKRTYYCYCERRDEAIQWMTALRLACRLGDMAIPVGRPLIAGQDEGAFKERFLVQSPIIVHLRRSPKRQHSTKLRQSQSLAIRNSLGCSPQSLPLPTCAARPIVLALRPRTLHLFPHHCSPT